ncbi:MAG: hypothetical protein Q8O42_14045 [Acidobacteriota bacterium]|nr:hypothetical protein [Acidobacteriota bacterium]
MRWPLKLVLASEAAVLGVMLMIVADQFAHRRVQDMAGVNSWGYRGLVMPAKAAGEIRIAMVGGDHGFGWGMAPEETTAAYLRGVIARRLAAGDGSAIVTAVNLSAVGLPAPAYADRIAHFAYLAPDVICLYVDLTDRAEGATLPPIDSAITALTGYVPMLPLLLRDKGRAMTMAGKEIAGSAVGAFGGLLRNTDRALHSWVSRPVPASTSRREALGRAVDAALASARAVVTVVPMPVAPSEWPAHRDAIDVFTTRAASEPRLRTVDLATIDRLSDPQLRLDGYNLGAAGQSLAANAIAPAVFAVIEPAGLVPPSGNSSGDLR